jgi:hypothetical protein
MRIARWWVFPAVVMLGGCASSLTASNVPSAWASASEATQTVIATASPRAIASPLATPSATPAGMNLIDELVAVVTDDLVVRSRPGTSSDSEIYPARLNAPSIVYVIDGPEDADGYAWYLVDPLAPPCYLGCEEAPQPGWVAAAGKDGERWLAEEPENPECPQSALEEVSRAYPELWLHCFGARDLILNGVVGAESTEAPPGWPWEHRIGLYEPGYLGPVTGCVDACNIPSLTIAFDGERGVPSPLRATRVSGHFDDAKAPECRSSGTELDQRILTHGCRMVFVVTSWD